MQELQMNDIYMFVLKQYNKMEKQRAPFLMDAPQLTKYIL